MLSSKIDPKNEEHLDRLSEIVSDILKIDGFFMEHVNIYRSKCLLCEKIIKDLFGFTSIHCGSSMAEGSQIVGSDKDSMKVMPKIICINEDCNLSDGESNIFTLLMDKCKHGYTRLRAHALEQNIFLPMLTKDGDSHFLSSEEFRKLDKTSMTEINPDQLIKQFSYNGGPCITTEMLNVVCDSTCGIECHSWPVSATEWIYRQRLKNWPSQCIVDKIALFPVHVVPVGDITSKISSTQWRFSFNYAERELLWNFTDKQFQCYVLLKCIFKAKFKDFNELSGYHMKNLIFWISEEYGVTLFTNTNLLGCVKICLERYEDNIKQNLLSHYFYRNRNLLSCKLKDETQEQILNQIRKILEHTFLAILESSHFIPAGKQYLSIYNMYYGSEKHFISHLETQLPRSLSKCHQLYKFEIFSQLRQVFVSIAHYPSPTSLQKINVLIHDLETGNSLPDNISPYMIKTAYLFCIIQSGMMSCKNTTSIKNTHKIDRFIDADLAFTKGSDFDELSGKLYSVTFALLKNEIDKARSILRPVMDRTKLFVYIGRCSPVYFLHVLRFYKTVIYCNTSDSFNVEDLSYCYDMVFPLYAVDFVPDAIKYELYLQKEKEKDSLCCNYHPVVYAFYLMFVIAVKKDKKKKQKKEILNGLSKFIEKSHGPLDLHRAYNLLGFCYYKCGQRNKAVAAYIRSIQVKSNSTNVGVYHLCVIALEYINSYNTEDRVSSTSSLLKRVTNGCLC